VYTVDTTASGQPAHAYFCPNCSTLLYAIPSAMEGVVSVKTGVLDGDGINKFVPNAEVNAYSRATWLAPQEGAESFEKMPPGFPTKDS
jgi:hypothetical protein